MTGPDPLLVLSEVGMRFGEHTALEGISFAVRPGEIVGLLGHNGAGKTTTIRLCNGVLQPSSGQVRLFGRDPMREGDSLRERTGVVVENAAVDERQSARELLLFFARIHDLPRAEAEERVIRLLGDFGLADRADDRLATFSRGMRQSVALARALLHRPELLLLDEPTSGLDPQAAYRLRTMIREISATHGGGILLSTHDLHEARELCDRVAVVRRGRLLAFAEPVELARRWSVESVVHVDAEGIEPTLAELPAGVVLRERSGIRCVFAVRDPELIPELVTRIVRAGGRVHRVEPLRPDLEGAYLRLHEEEPV
ncbi:ABC transporter ATP-binding protein [Sciscionella marina]|uniref:ABC transporter ATP-binding protein n=1 Tax=Sciscionella marina TaxID=508770 RepID=UPI0003813520|nr:ABC transporter ATP-binding protein [Sciscionella marina]